MRKADNWILMSYDWLTADDINQNIVNNIDWNIEERALIKVVKVILSLIYIDENINIISSKMILTIITDNSDKNHNNRISDNQMNQW